MLAPPQLGGPNMRILWIFLAAFLITGCEDSARLHRAEECTPDQPSPPCEVSTPEGCTLPGYRICQSDKTWSQQCLEDPEAPEIGGACQPDAEIEGMQCGPYQLRCENRKLICKGGRGRASEEICANGIDDDCNGATDESTFELCWAPNSGPPFHGECRPGTKAICGASGEGECEGQVFPVAHSELNCLEGSKDRDCDGQPDSVQLTPHVPPADVVFFIDVSPSMDEKIGALKEAITMFAEDFDKHDSLRIALTYLPAGGDGLFAPVHCGVLIPFNGPQEFAQDLATRRIPRSDSAAEPTWDCPYMAAMPDGQRPAPFDQLAFRSSPGGVRKVFILLTDEAGQNRILPEPLTETIVANYLASQGVKFHVFAASHSYLTGRPFYEDFDDIASTTGGEVFQIESSTEVIVARLKSLLARTVCSN